MQGMITILELKSHVLVILECELDDYFYIHTNTYTHTHTHTPHLHLMGLVAMVNAVVAKIHFYTLVKIGWYGDCSQLGFSVHGILQARILE